MLEDVEFHTSRYAPEIARSLDLEGGGQRPMPLLRTASSPPEARHAVKELPASEAEQAGRYLYLLCWDEAHSTAGWFRGAGGHPTFPKPGAEVADRGYRRGLARDPLAFIQFCESARKRPGSNEERLAREVQLLEWPLLFDHCARGSAC